MSIRVAPPHQISLLSIAVFSALVSPSISFSAQYQLVEVPTLTGWTVETSVSEGFDTQKLGGTTDGWGDMNFQPITTGFEIEKKLKERLNIPVFHDDQHGTAIIVLSGLMNALKIVNKKEIAVSFL